MTHAIHDVTQWTQVEEEHVGSKHKVWLQHPGGQRWLLKHPRAATGEHWAEKVAASVAHLMGVPHATVELASLSGVVVSISRDFTAAGTVPLVLANMLLDKLVPHYDRTPKPRQHTVELALRLLGAPEIAPPDGSRGMHSAADVFVGYLMLDALVGNTDRHHENWGFLFRPNLKRKTMLELAPSFDHASSLGRDLQDEERGRRLDASDPRVTVERYAAKGRSPWFRAGNDPKALKVREAFLRAHELRPAAAQSWLARLAAVPTADLLGAVDALPAETASPSARCFAQSMLECNSKFLLAHRRS